MTQPVPIAAGTFEVLGTRIHAVAPDDVTRHIERTVAEGDKTYIVFCTASSVLSARDGGSVRRALECAGLIAPDGMPLVWLGQKEMGSAVSRVYGPDFMLHLMATTGGSLRHYFYGGHPGVAEEMVARLRARFPELEVAGILSPEPHLSGTESCAEDVRAINSACPDIVWVGLGHPKQELWMHTHRNTLDAPVLAGVGAAFDFLSGRKREAPSWMKRSGLQWLHRLGHEPRRLWKRYLIGNARFVLLLAGDRLKPGIR